MNIEKIIYDIKESVRAYSNDAVITNARILHLVDVMRAKYIRQHQQRNLGESTFEYTQTLNVQMGRVDRSYLPATMPVDKEILKSVKQLPRLINRYYFRNVEVRPLDRISMEIEYMAKQRAIYASTMADNYSCAFIDDDGYLYITGSDTIHLFLKYVAVTCMLEVPIDIIAFNDMTSEITEYPLSEHLWSLMKMEILELLFKELSIPIDTISENKTTQ